MILTFIAPFLIAINFIFIHMIKSRALGNPLSFWRQGCSSSHEIFKDFVRSTHCRDDSDISLLQFIPNIDGSNTRGEEGGRNRRRDRGRRNCSNLSCSGNWHLVGLSTNLSCTNRANFFLFPHKCADKIFVPSSLYNHKQINGAFCIHAGNCFLSLRRWDGAFQHGIRGWEIASR